MREAAYRAMPRAGGMLGAASVDSYVVYIARVERELKVDADSLDLSDDGILAIRDQLHRAGVNPHSIANSLTALRRYRGLR